MFGPFLLLHPVYHRAAVMSLIISVKKHSWQLVGIHPSIHYVITVAGEYILNYEFFPNIQMYGVLYILSDKLFI